MESKEDNPPPPHPTHNKVSIDTPHLLFKFLYPRHKRLQDHRAGMYCKLLGWLPGFYQDTARITCMECGRKEQTVRWHRTYFLISMNTENLLFPLTWKPQPLRLKTSQRRHNSSMTKLCGLPPTWGDDLLAESAAGSSQEQNIRNHGTLLEFFS